MIQPDAGGRGRAGASGATPKVRSAEGCPDVSTSGDSPRQTQTRLLYIMHVDWHWIKQRPQFLAEELSDQGLTLRVLYVPGLRHRVVRNRTRVSVWAAPILPRWFGRAGRFWNASIGRLGLWLAACFFRPTAVWLTFPMLYPVLPARLRRLPVFYDAMDVAHGFFPNSPAKAAAVLASERQAVLSATRVFCSSEHIARQLGSAHGLSPRRTVLVPNACEGGAGWAASSLPTPSGVFRLTYFGTISEWFDFGALKTLLLGQLDVSVTVYGPLAVAFPEIPRLYYGGILSHEAVPRVARDTDCFVMPFHRTALVEGVDPVKLYEYIALARPVICRYYPALDRFRDAVNFYCSHEELPHVVRKVRSGAGRQLLDGARAEFVRGNTWSARARAVVWEIAECTPQ